MIPFFIEIPNLWAWADNFGADTFWGIWGIFGQFISTVFGTVSPLSIIIPTKKQSLYIPIPNIYLGLGFEFGPKIISDLAFMCPLSVTHSMAKGWLVKFIP